MSHTQEKQALWNMEIRPTKNKKQGWPQADKQTTTTTGMVVTKTNDHNKKLHKHNRGKGCQPEERVDSEQSSVSSSSDFSATVSFRCTVHIRRYLRWVTKEYPGGRFNHRCDNKHVSDMHKKWQTISTFSIYFLFFIQKYECETSRPTV